MTFLQVRSTSDNNDNDLNDVKMNILDSILIQITSDIKVNRIGTYILNSKCRDQYNVAKWDLITYTIQKDHEKKEILIGDFLVKTTKLYQISSAVSWFTA